MQHGYIHKVGCHSRGRPPRGGDVSLSPDAAECRAKTRPCARDVVNSSQFQTAYKCSRNREPLGKEE
jgi:hypothetical protein